MNDEANETILDIVAEKRREAQHIRTINDTPGVEGRLSTLIWKPTASRRRTGGMGPNCAT